MTSVRSLLTGQSDFPPFRMLLAPGFEQHLVTQQTAAALAQRAGDTFRQASRPDLDAQLSSSLRRSFSAMQKAGSKIVYLPMSPGEEVTLPMSMVGSIVQGANGGSLDPQVSQLFRERGAEFLDVMKTTVRWESEERGSGEFAGAISHQINYVIPVPNSGRRRAAMFTTTVLSGVQDPIDDELLRECVALSDAMIATFAWVDPDAATRTLGTSTH